MGPLKGNVAAVYLHVPTHTHTDTYKDICEKTNKHNATNVLINT